MISPRRQLLLSILLGLGLAPLRTQAASCEPESGERSQSYRWDPTDEELEDADVSRMKSLRVEVVQASAEIQVSAKRLASALANSLDAPHLYGPLTTPFKLSDSSPPVFFGYIVETNWMPMKGRTVGLLLWTRELETELKLMVVIQPTRRQGDNPVSLAVLATARERANKNYKWIDSEIDIAKAALEFSKPAVLRAVQMARIAERKGE